MPSPSPSPSPSILAGEPKVLKHTGKYDTHKSWTISNDRSNPCSHTNNSNILCYIYIYMLCAMFSWPCIFHIYVCSQKLNTVLSKQVAGPAARIA